MAASVETLGGRRAGGLVLETLETAMAMTEWSCERLQKLLSFLGVTCA